MKRALLLVTGLILFGMAYSQTVENIRVEPEGENIKISYRIGGSTESQLYTVFLACSMDGGQRFEPRSVIGDVGQNIRGGRSFYTVIWDVFEDVEEVGNAEFFVRVELISDAGTPARGTDPDRAVENNTQTRQEGGNEQAALQQQDRPSLNPKGPESERSEPSPFEPNFESSGKSGERTYARYLYIAYTGSDLNPYGFSFGTMRNWGAYGSLRLGRYDEFLQLMEGSATAGLTKNIVNLGSYRLHGYAGAGIGNYFDNFDIEAGVSNILFERLKLTVGLEYPGNYASFVYGIGIVF